MLRALARLKKLLAKPKEKMRAAQQFLEVSPQSSEGEGTLTPDKPGMVFCESDSEEEGNLMVNDTIIPMTARMEILVPYSGVNGTITPLLDSGCIRCIISLLTLEKLGLRLRKLR